MAAGGSQTSCQRSGSAEAQHWVFAWCKQVLWQKLVPFGILAGGWAREMVLVRPLFPAKLSSVVRQLSHPLSSSPPALQAELLAYNLLDVKSCLLLEHTPSVLSTFASQTQGLCLAGGPPLRPWFPPASPCSAHRLAALLPTLFRGPLVCALLQRLRSASLLVVFWVI